MPEKDLTRQFIGLFYSSNSKKKAVGGSQAATVVLETLKHLEKFRTVEPKNLDNFVQRLQENNLELTDREKLHLVNLCPTVRK